LLDPGDEVIIPSPFWVSYPDMVELAGATPVTVHCPQDNNFKLRPEQLEEAITPRTRMIILNSPSNPTGVFYRRADLEGLAEVLLRHEDIAIVSDDIYYRILFGGQKWVNIAMADERLKERTFIVNGVSKTYCMTGWRIGWLVGDTVVIKAATNIQSQSTSNPSSVSQWASLAALLDDQSIVREMAETFEQRSRYVLERLREIPGVTCPAPDGAFYAFPNFSAYFNKRDGGRVIGNSLDLADYLMEKAHVAAVPGSAFGEDCCIRMSYALSMEDLKEGFDRIVEAMGRLS
jgi:aspartate aminotransferase